MEIDGNQGTPFDTTAELIHEALEELGWPGNAQALANRVKRLNLGLPAEDEFSMILTWLGKCQLVHKLDELQSPKESKTQYRVPDLLAIFTHAGREIPVLIEVKSTKDDLSLKWRPDYLESLQRYGQTLKLPVLVAWKSRGWWMLFELNHFKRPNQNYKITFEEANKENLMGVLAGDWLFMIKEGVGFHILLRKEAKLGEINAEEGHSEQWRVRVEDVYFTNGEGQRHNALSNGLWLLLSSALEEESSQFNGETILQSFIEQQNETLHWAYHSYVGLLFSSNDKDQPIRWRDVLVNQRMPAGAAAFREGAEDGLKLGFVRYILDQVPRTKPPFLVETSGNGQTLRVVLNEIVRSSPR